MILKKNGSLSWLEFELLAEVPGLVHGVFSRQGGVSQPPFDSLNASFTVGDLFTAGDRPEAVQENRRRIQQSLQFPSLISMGQVHGSAVMLVDNREQPLLVCDGLITAEKGRGLMAQHADCQAAILYDPIHRALAVVHAGWRGQVQNIYKICIEKMGAQFGSRPQELLIGISPSLGPSHAEFIHYKTEFPEEFWPFADLYHFNLWEIARYQLEQCGVLPHHIEIAQICTYTDSANYFSYRRNKVRGCNATVACLL